MESIPKEEKIVPHSRKNVLDRPYLFKALAYGLLIVGITLIFCLWEEAITFRLVSEKHSLSRSLIRASENSKFVDNQKVMRHQYPVKKNDTEEDISNGKEDIQTMLKEIINEQKKDDTDVKAYGETENHEMISEQVPKDIYVDSKNLNVIHSTVDHITVLHLTHGTSTKSNKRAYHDACKDFYKNELSTMPKKVWAFWFGKPMEGNRLSAYNNLKANIGVPVELVTDETLKDYSVKQWPIHPAIFTGALSAVHKADYLRSYFMYHYGGGYHDVKRHEKNKGWGKYFAEFDSDPTLWLYGIKEGGVGGMACDESYMLDGMAITDEDFDSEKVLDNQVQLDTALATKTGFSCGKNYENHREKIILGTKGKLSIEMAAKPKNSFCCSEIFQNYNKYTFVSNGAYIMRDHTDFGYDWLRLIEAHLDMKFETIKEHPAPTQRCCIPNRPPYPIRWAELHGEAFHPLQIKYQGHIKTGLPRWQGGPYKGASEGH